MSHLPAPKRLFRAMKGTSDGTPLCGSHGNELGVRPLVDIREDEGGQVRPRTGGLSTTPDDPAPLPSHVRPPNFGGHGRLPVFALDVGSLPTALAARRDPKSPVRHAFVEPAYTMLLADLQQRLCGTQATWKELEP